MNGKRALFTNDVASRCVARGATLVLASLAVLGLHAQAVAQSAQPADEQQAQSTHSKIANDGRRLRLFAQVGYGPQDDSDAGMYGVALGVKASYTPWGFVHVGIDGTFHVGTQFGDELNRVDYAGLELGAPANYRRVGFTPYLTGGFASVSSQRNINPSYATVYLGLGLAFDVITYDWLLLGADVRVIGLNSISQGDNSGVTLQPDVFLMIGTRL